MNAELWPMNELLAKDAEIERLKAAMLIGDRLETLEQHLKMKREIDRLKAIIAGQKEALNRWAQSCTCEQLAREATK